MGERVLCSIYVFKVRVDSWSGCVVSLLWRKLAKISCHILLNIPLYHNLCIQVEQIIFLDRPPCSDPTPGMCEVFRGIGLYIKQTKYLAYFPRFRPQCNDTPPSSAQGDGPSRSGPWSGCVTAKVVLCSISLIMHQAL